MGVLVRYLASGSVKKSLETRGVIVLLVLFNFGQHF